MSRKLFNTRTTEGEDIKLRRVTTAVMIAAVGMILVALVSAGLFFRGQTDEQRIRADRAEAERVELRRELGRSTDAVNALLAQVAGNDQARAAAGEAAVLQSKQVSDSLAARINTLFAEERKISKAEADRQLAAIRAAQADLERRIAAIVSGPAGPSGAPGAAGSPGSALLPSVCLINCPPAVDKGKK